MNSTPPTRQTWSQLLTAAYQLFDDLERRGFPQPPFSLGGGTVLMFRFRHRLSKDIDFFGYDAQWLPLVSPRLNEFAAGMASNYSEQANTVKIILPRGDIDFVIAGDVATPVVREKASVEGREIFLDPTSEILAKKLFYRAFAFTARDVYDMSAAIDLDPIAARRAVQAAAPKFDLLIRRLDELANQDPAILLDGLIPFETSLHYAEDMVSKVKNFVTAEIRGDANSLDPKP